MLTTACDDDHVLQESHTQATAKGDNASGRTHIPWRRLYIHMYVPHELPYAGLTASKYRQPTVHLWDSSDARLGSHTIRNHVPAWSKIVLPCPCQIHHPWGAPPGPHLPGRVPVLTDILMTILSLISHYQLLITINSPVFEHCITLTKWQKNMCN